jgi:PAS domain S-box-containing protein
MHPPADPFFQDTGSLARSIADSSDDAIFAKDLEGRYRYANPATLGVFGRSAGEVIGHRDDEILRDAALARRLMDNDREVLATGRVSEQEVPMPGPAGATRHWLARKMPLRDAAGQVVGVLGIARDITGRKVVQAERDAALLKLQMGIQAAGLVMAEIDYRTDENHISGELARLLSLGEGPTTVPRQAIFDRVHPEDRPRYLEAVQAATDPSGNGHMAIDVRALLPGGEVRWLHIRLQVTFEQREGGMQPLRGICAARDVTAEMTAERKLRAAQRLTQSVIEGAGALVYAKDLQGRYILSNQAWRSQHGLTLQQAEHVTDVDLFGAELAQRLQANDRQVAASGEPMFVQERVLMRGEPMVYRSSKFPLYDEAGEVFAVCGVSTDITDVVEADRRKDEFIALLAHELRNPLAPIRNGLEILRRVGELPVPAARARDMMERQLNHLVRLVDDLLDVSRIGRGKLELRLAPLTLQTVLDHALEACRPALQAAGHTLEVDLPAEPVRLVGDLTRLAQVASNLVNNAIRYTPSGGRIAVSAAVELGQAVVRVADTGHGIEPAMLPRVFELFTQGDGAGRTQGGLGIGLWLVRRLVEMHGGSIEAASPGRGGGSTFTVRLPLGAA